MGACAGGEVAAAFVQVQRRVDREYVRVGEVRLPRRHDGGVAADGGVRLRRRRDGAADPHVDPAVVVGLRLRPQRHVVAVERYHIAVDLELRYGRRRWPRELPLDQNRRRSVLEQEEE